MLQFARTARLINVLRRHLELLVIPDPLGIRRAASALRLADDPSLDQSDLLSQLHNTVQDHHRSISAWLWLRSHW